MKKHSIFLLLALAANNALSIGNPFSSQQTDSCPIPQMVEINELNMVGPHPIELAVIFKNLKERKKIRNNQILLFGPSGTGKSKFAQEIAKYADCNFIEISGSNFIDVKDPIQRLASVFKQAKNGGSLFSNFDHSKPTVISIEEAHFISNQYDSSTEKTATALWTSLDRIKGSNVFVFLSTNHRDRLHPQLIRRLGPNEIKTKLPDETTRYNLFKFYLADFPELEEHFECFTKASDGGSHGEIEAACYEAINQSETALSRDYEAINQSETALSRDLVLSKIGKAINKQSNWEYINQILKKNPKVTEIGTAVVVAAIGTTAAIIKVIISSRSGSGD